MPALPPELVGAVLGAVLILTAFTVGFLLGGRARHQRLYGGATRSTRGDLLPDHECSDHWGIQRRGESFWRCYICETPGPPVVGIKR